MPSPGPNITKKYSHIIWVLLDEPKASKKVVKSGATQKSVKEPAADNLKAKLSIPYKKFTGVKPCYTPSNEQRNACDLIITEITNCWYSIIRKLPRLPFKIDNESLDIDELGRYLVENSAPGDVKFLENVINTQLFVNAVEEFYNLV